MEKRIPQRRWFSFQLRTLLILMALCCLGMFAKIQWDWQQKMNMVKTWAEVVQVGDDWNYKTEPYTAPVLPISAKDVSKPEQLALLQAAAISLRDPKMQIGCLKLLVELHPDSALPHLYKIAAKARGTEVRVFALRLIGLHRDVDGVRNVRPLLDDPDSAVRGAAAECLGMIHCPSYEISANQDPFQSSVRWIDSRPPIHVSTMGKFTINAAVYSDSFPAKEIKLPNEIRQRIVELMIDGESFDERAGAARALVRWQPEEYQLRYAEWGVWLDSGGELELVRSVLDEIPEFVHRLGADIATLESERVNQIMIINKPIVHITVDQPMAVDVSAFIRQGRPWYAFPKPSNYVVGVGQQSGYRAFDPFLMDGKGEVELHPLAEFDKTVAGTLDQPHDGYPWLLPPFAVIGPISGSLGSFYGISDVGVRWNSVICTPTQRDWMEPPQTAADPKFQWWNRLREVPSSWVSNANDSERFLYYDGPTNVLSPTITVQQRDSVVINKNDMFSANKNLLRSASTPEVTQSAKINTLRKGMVIHVDGNNVRGAEFTLASKSATVAFDTDLQLAGKQVENNLLAMLTDYGLTKPESMGLIDAWRPQFFNTNGLRLLTVMTSKDYDTFCPLLMHPKPTEVVRVGIVLQELENFPK